MALGATGQYNRDPVPGLRLSEKVIFFSIVGIGLTF